MVDTIRDTVGSAVAKLPSSGVERPGTAALTRTIVQSEGSEPSLLNGFSNGQNFTSNAPAPAGAFNTLYTK